MPTKIYHRPEFETLIQRLAEQPTRLIVIAGPRQIGKSTLIREVLKDSTLNKPSQLLEIDDPLLSRTTYRPATSLALSSERSEAWLVQQWQFAETIAAQSKNGLVLVFDEIQRIQNWSRIIKGLWDSGRATELNMHVVLLGSAPILVQKGLTESLAGRFELIRLSHWSFIEMHEAFGFSLEEYLYFGGYPGSAAYIQDQPRWHAYVKNALVATNIQKDIFELNRVDKPALLQHLFKLSCDYSGQIMAYNNMADHLKTEKGKAHTNTIADYLELLSQAGLIFTLQKYSGSDLRMRTSSPKLNVMNTALMTIEDGYTFDEAKADRTRWGRIVESAVGAHLYNTSSHGCGLFYWREKKDEVDFILASKHRIIAIEVKSGNSSKSIHGLQAFSKKYPAAKPLLVGGMEGIPLTEFLSQPTSYWLSI